MEYNTGRSHLLYSEYGRGVEQMVKHCLKIEDREKRSLFAKLIVKTMAILNPEQKEMENYEQKFYDHIYIISNFKLDIDCPYPKPKLEEVRKRPNQLSYSNQRIRFRYYGRTLENMIMKAAEFEEEDKKNTLLNLLAVQMKKSYYLWNNDNLTDSILGNHIHILSSGKLAISDDLKAEVYHQFYQKGDRKKKYNTHHNSNNNNSNNKRNNHFNKNNNNGNNKKRK